MDPGAIGDVLIPITMFAAAFGILYLFFSTRHRERLVMIEKGADPTLFQRPLTRRNSLRFGMFLIGIALHILLVNILSVTTRLKEEVVYFSIIFLSSGASLVLFYTIFKSKE
jgi:hypothetical protein